MKKTLILLAVIALSAAQAFAAGITIPADLDTSLSTLGTRITTETNRAQVAEAALNTLITNRYTKAESDAAYATAAEGSIATNAATTLASVFGSVSVVATSVSTGAATVVCTAKNIFGNTLAAEKSVICWFEESAHQAYPFDSEEISFSLTKGDLDGRWVTTAGELGTNRVWVMTTASDGILSIGVTFATAEAGTNYFSLLGPNGTFSRTAVPHID